LKKKNFAGALAFAALLAGAIPAFAADSDFRDVPKSSYAYSAIVELAERGVVSGYSDGTFHPNETVTRGQFAGMIARAFNLQKGAAILRMFQNRKLFMKKSVKQQTLAS